MHFFTKVLTCELLLLWSERCVASSYSFTVFNSSINPYPPNQPKEFGSTLNTVYSLTALSTGAVLEDADTYGYQFSSYSLLAVRQSVAGEADSAPTSVYSVNNYSAAFGSMYTVWEDQTCTLGAGEGDAAYPGYDYYGAYLKALISYGYEVYFYEGGYKTYGDCYVYNVLVPWASSDDYPGRNLTYTLAYEQDTGYIRE